MKLYPHQVTGVEWLQDRPRALLLDEMGLGKTITAIAAADAAGARRVLCIVPAVVLWNWKREWERWSPERQVCVVDSGKPIRARDVAWIKSNYRVDGGVVVTTHGLLLSEGVRKLLFAQRWDLLVVDEAHFFRTPTAKRTRALYARTGGKCLVDRADRVWGLTGTPMPNNAGELWTHLHGLFPERLDGLTYRQFRKRYCVFEPVYVGGRHVDDRVVTNQNVEELRGVMDGLSLRRLKKDVLPDLPPVRYEVVALRPEVVLEELSKLDHDFAAVYSDGYDLADVAGLRGSEDFSRWRRLCGLAKAPAAAEMLRAELDGDCDMERGELDKVVVFAHHVDVVDALVRGIGPERCVRIVGETSPADRQRAVDRFQDDPEIRVAVCNLIAGGTGVTFTAASEVVVVEASFVPGENAQAVDRCHRIGQKARVRARYVALAGTVDEDVTRALRRKVTMIKEILK